jgi:hypothetical protein
VNLGGLAPDQAPPAEGPLVLFHLAPPLLGVAGLLLAWQGEQVLGPHGTPTSLALAHLLVLGVLAPVMCGVLLQIAPVLLGVPYPRVRLVARLTAAGLGGGSLLLAAGFLSGHPGVLLGGSLTADAGLVVFLAGSYKALRAAAGRREALWAARLAALALAVTAVLGLALALSRGGWLTLPQHPRWVDTHAAWGLAGWVGLLLAGVGMQLVPLFYVTPSFPGWIRRALPFAVFGLLLLATASGGLLPSPELPIAGLFLVYLLHGVAALRVEQRRQRPRRDACLWLWQASHLMVPAAFLAWLGGAGHGPVGTLLLGGALSFVVGSLMKIVPFLGWLDLQQRRIAAPGSQVKVPRLRALLPERQAHAIAATLGGVIAAVPAGLLAPSLARLGGGLLAACAGLLGHALWRIARLRRDAIREIDRPVPRR